MEFGIYPSILYSKKSNSIPDVTAIEKLEKRNEILLGKISEIELMKTKKPTKELKIAIEKDYVKKFWISSKT